MGKRYITSGEPSARLSTGYGRHAVPTGVERPEIVAMMRRNRERARLRNAVFAGHPRPAMDEDNPNPQR